MDKKIIRTKMLDEAKQQSEGKRPLIEMLIFFLIMGIGSTASAVLLYPAMMYIMYTDEKIVDLILGNTQFDSQTFFDAMTDFYANMPEWMFVLNLFSTVAIIIACMVYCKAIEKRSFATMGFRKRHAILEYLGGIVIGVILIGVVAVIGIFSGAFEYKGISSFSIPMIIFYFLGYIIQGASEEILIHGYYMTSVARKSDTFYALFISSFVFALFHMGNNGVNIVAFINLFLFGLLMGLYILKRGNIWGICAIHSVWNFIQGTVMGLSVSGTHKSSSIFTFEVKEGYNLVTGGDFGPEGGLIVTLVLLIAVGLVKSLKTNKHEISDIVFEEAEEEVA